MFIDPPPNEKEAIYLENAKLHDDLARANDRIKALEKEIQNAQDEIQALEEELTFYEDSEF